MRQIPELTERDHQLLQQRICKTDSCWLWMGTKSPQGYGQIGLKGEVYKAARVMLAIAKGPSELQVLHSCRNRHCVNPEHLRYGTAQENADDRVVDGTNTKGSKHGNSKLTEDQVREIRASTRSKWSLCQKYSVSETTIGDIRARRLWKHI